MNIRALLREASPASRRARLLERRFDVEFGLDTAATINVSQMTGPKSALAHAFRYQATSAGTLRKLIETLSIDHKKYTFIDIGAGKGRPLLVASLFPFLRIIGVEFDLNLCRVAEENVHRYNPPGRLCWDIRIVNSDAAAFEPPRGPLIVYMYNPFDGTMLQRVIDNLRSVLIESAGESLILYVQPDHRTVLDGCSFLQLEHVTESALIYRVRRPAE